MDSVSQRRHYPALSGLRFLFIMMIVMYHCWPLFASEMPDKITLFFRENGGNWGNYMFFTISGFLMCAHYKENVHGGTTCGQFLLNRLRKLYPQYLVSMYACVLFNFVVTGFTYVNFKYILLNSLMMATGWVENIYQYNSPHWFAGVLMLCYVAFYGICVLARKQKRYFTYGCVALMLWGYILLSRNWNFPFCYFWDGEGFLSFFTGCLVYEFLHTAEIPEKMRARIIGAAAAAVTVFFGLSWFVGFEQLAGDSRYVLALLICPAILMACVKWPVLSKILGNPLMERLGKLSTTLFFWHIPVYQVVYYLWYGKGRFLNNESSWMRGAAFIALLMAFCVVCAWIFEKLPALWCRSSKRCEHMN